jgi:hypothetical protein
MACIWSTKNNMLLTVSFLLYLPQILFGFWIAHTLWREPAPQALWFKLFLGIPLGLGLWSLGYFLWLWVGLSRFIFPWIELAISTVFALLSLPTLKLLTVSFSFRPLKSPINLVFLLVALATAALFGWQLYMNPHGYEDAWFIWNLDARFIYLAQDWKILYAPGGPGWHPDYPLLVSLNIVSGWVILGQDSPRIQMVVTTLFTLILPGILFSGLSLLKDTKQAALATIVLLASPMIVNYGISQQADIPVAGCVLASLVLAALYFKTRAGNLLLLAGLTTSLTAWAKNEGYLFIFISAVLMTVFLAALGQIRTLKNYVIGSAIPLSVILLFKFTLPVANDLFAQNNLAQFLDGNRYLVILQKLFEVAANLGWWSPVSLLIVLLIYGLLAWFDYPEPLIVKFIGLALFLQLLGYFVIYLITPHDLLWHVNTSFERLLLQLFPAFLLLFFYATRSPDFNLSEGWNNASHH